MGGGDAGARVNAGKKKIKSWFLSPKIIGLFDFGGAFLEPKRERNPRNLEESEKSREIREISRDPRGI